MRSLGPANHTMCFEALETTPKHFKLKKKKHKKPQNLNQKNKNKNVHHYVPQHHKNVNMSAVRT